MKCFSAVDFEIDGEHSAVFRFYCNREEGHDDWHAYEKDGVPWYVWQGDRPSLGPDHGGPMEKLAWEAATQRLVIT